MCAPHPEYNTFMSPENYVLNSLSLPGSVSIEGFKDNIVSIRVRELPSSALEE